MEFLLPRERGSELSRKDEGRDVLGFFFGLMRYETFGCGAEEKRRLEREGAGSSVT